MGEVAGGRLVNLLSNDIARFDFSFMFLHYLWIVPIQAAVVLYFLYEAAGYAPFVGLFGVVIIILPLQGKSFHTIPYIHNSSYVTRLFTLFSMIYIPAGLTKLTAIVRRLTAQRTDKRIKLMSEIINGIQVVHKFIILYFISQKISVLTFVFG